MSQFWAQLWEQLNKALPVLLIGSGLGWVFLNFVWQPYQAGRARRERAASFRSEVELRLGEALFRLSQGNQVHDVLEGASTSPEFRGTSLVALIAVGWDLKMARRCLERIQAIKLDEQDRESAATVQAAKRTLSDLARELGLEPL